MTIEFKTHPEANYNPFPVTYYCYHNDCPARQGEYKHPRSDGEYKWTTVISKKGNPYRKKCWVCSHCGKIMTGTVSMYTFS